VRELLARDVHRHQGIEVDIGIDADCVPLLLVIGPAVCAAVACPQTKAAASRVSRRVIFMAGPFWSFTASRFAKSCDGRGNAAITESLAVTLGFDADLSQGGSVVVVAHVVAHIIASPGSSIDSMNALKDIPLV